VEWRERERERENRAIRLSSLSDRSRIDPSDTRSPGLSKSRKETKSKTQIGELNEKLDEFDITQWRNALQTTRCALRSRLLGMRNAIRRS